MNERFYMNLTTYTVHY